MSEVISDILPWKKDWMKLAQTAIRSKKICEVVLPGSHDSGTYSITPDCPYAHNFKSSKFLTKILPKIGLDGTTRRIFSKWAITQTRNIYDQLCDGIRYLDIRICYNEGTMHIWHGMCGEEISVFFREIESFAREHPHEIIILDLSPSHFGNFNDEAFKQFIDLTKEIFSDILCDRRYLSPESKVEEFWEKKQNIIFVFDNKHINETLDFSWDPSELYSYWPNHCKNAKDWTMWAEGHLSKRSKHINNLFVLQGVITPDAKMILSKNKIRSIYDIADRLNSSVINLILKTGTKRHNIVILDYYENCEFVESIRWINVCGSRMFSDESGFVSPECSGNIRSISTNDRIVSVGIKKTVLNSFNTKKIIVESSTFLKEGTWLYNRINIHSELPEKISGFELFQLKGQIFFLAFSETSQKIYIWNYDDVSLAWKFNTFIDTPSLIRFNSDLDTRHRYFQILKANDDFITAVYFLGNDIIFFSFNGKIVNIKQNKLKENNIDDLVTYRVGYNNNTIQLMLYFKDGSFSLHCYKIESNETNTQQIDLKDVPSIDSTSFWGFESLLGNSYLVFLDKSNNIYTYKYDGEKWLNRNDKIVDSSLQIQNLHLINFKNHLYLIGRQKSGILTLKLDPSDDFEGWKLLETFNEYSDDLGYSGESNFNSFHVTSNNESIDVVCRHKWGLLCVTFDGEKWSYFERKIHE